MLAHSHKVAGKDILADSWRETGRPEEPIGQLELRSLLYEEKVIPA